MIEAAVVFPLVVVTLFVLIMGMVYLFDQTFAASSLRCAVIGEAGCKAGTMTILEEELDAGSVHTDVYRVKPCAASEKTIRMHRFFGLPDAQRSTLSAHQYICNEKTQIRLWDLFE